MDGKFNGQIANTVFQVSSEPPAVSVSINKKNLTHEYLTASRRFTVSVLEFDTQMKFIGQFGFKSGREIDKFQGVNHKPGRNGIPVVLDNSIAYFEAEVYGMLDAGSHTVFIGKVTDADVLKQGKPLTYADYHEIKKGLTPRNAATYLKSDAKENEMEKYRCRVCGYVYDPAKGDSDSNIKPGTAFKDLPDNWVCPVCGAGKDEFEKI